MIFESDFSSPDGGLFGGERGFARFFPDVGTASGQYTEHGTLSLSAELLEGQGTEVASGANTVGVFVGGRELVDLSDVSVEAHATPVEWETGIAWGIRCRQQGDAERDLLPPEYYEAALQLDEDGLDAALWRITDEEASTAMLDTTAEFPSIVVQEREWNYLRLDCIGNTIALYVDGRKILEATDDTYASGNVSLFAAAFVPGEIPDMIGASAIAEFDNLTIRELAATSESVEDNPSVEEEELLSHIPQSFDDCIRSEFGAGAGLAVIECGVSAAGGEITVTYSLFGKEADMYFAYDRNLAFMDVARDAGPCESAWPGEAPYAIGGEDAGRVACVDLGIGHIISWTDERLLIKGYAEGFGVDQQEFYEWWITDSGPI